MCDRIGTFTTPIMPGHFTCVPSVQPGYVEVGLPVRNTFFFSFFFFFFPPARRAYMFVRATNRNNNPLSYWGRRPFFEIRL